MNASIFLQIPSKYVFKKELSRGFMSRTSIFEDIGTGKFYVCKTFEKENFRNLELANISSHIAKTTQQQFSFVQPYTEKYETDEYLMLIRPYIAGDCLTETISSADESNFEQLYNIWKTIFDHFSELHSFGICPNFIKPNNIFILKNGSVILVDLLPPPTDVDLMLRSISLFYIGFLAPEFFSAKENIGKESDLWSLGVLLVFMLTKSLPWKSNNIFTMLQQINSCNLVTATKIPDEYMCVIDSLIQNKPELRKLNENISFNKKIVTIADDKKVTLGNTLNTKFMPINHSLKQSRSMTSLSDKGIQLRTREKKPGTNTRKLSLI